MVISLRIKIQRNKVTQLESTFLQNTKTYQDESTIIEQSRSELLLEWRELIQILKDADLQRRNKTLSETPEVVDGWKARKDESKNLATIKKTELDVLKKAHKNEQAQLKSVKDSLLKMRKARLLDNDGFDTELEAILNLVAKIYKEAYHGGDLNGVCCIRLLDKQKEVISSIKEMCIQRRETPRSHTVPCTLLELESKLTSFANLFQVLDITFSRL